MKFYLKVLKILSKYKYIIFLILIIFISYARLNKETISKYNLNETKFEGYISEYEYNEDKISFILKGKEKIKCNYYIDKKNNVNLNYGDNIILEGTIKEPSNNTIPNVFNYKNYLKNNGINYILTVDKIIKIEKSDNILFKIKNFIQKRIDKIDNTGYLSTFILGNKNYIDENAYDSYKYNGIIHIFSISGMHISLLTGIILKILDLFKKSKKNIFLVILFLFFYLIITNYQASIVRSIVFYTISQFFKLIRKNIKTKDILLISISLILLIYPNFLYNVGFLYSSIISYTLIYTSECFNKNYIINILLISLTSFLVSLPITINNNYSINLLSILINLIFVPLVSFILYPLSLITFIFPPVIYIFNVFIFITETLSKYFYNIKVFNIAIPKMNILTIIIYYILIILIYKINKKYILLLIMLIILNKYINNFNSNLYVYFLDVGQGDMEVIKYKDECILIDTGVKSYNSYEAGENYITFFKSIGIYDIDTLILTHGDADHIGNAEYLVNNYKIKKVIFNNNEYNDLEKSLIKILENKKIKYYQNLKEINLNRYKLYFLNTRIYDNENDSSNVIYFVYNNYKFLFMGDAEKDKEDDILKKYDIKNIDFFKVGHHGSNTSSSEEFINSIMPKYSLISVGKNNKYGHPKESVLNILSKSKIYRTDKSGTIEVSINKNGYNIRTNEP